MQQGPLQMVLRESDGRTSKKNNSFCFSVSVLPETETWLIECDKCWKSLIDSSCCSHVIQSGGHHYTGQQDGRAACARGALLLAEEANEGQAGHLRSPGFDPSFNSDRTNVFEGSPVVDGMLAQMATIHSMRKGSNTFTTYGVRSLHSYLCSCCSNRWKQLEIGSQEAAWLKDWIVIVWYVYTNRSLERAGFQLF